MANIRSTAIAIDGDTATLIVRNHDRWFWETEHDRPCDTCEKDRKTLDSDEPSDVYCPECDSTRRHTFTLDVKCVLPMCVNGQRGYWQDGHPCGYCNATGTSQLSVHVVEVIPIYDWNSPELPKGDGSPYIVLDSPGYELPCLWNGTQWSDAPLPDDAAPDMFCVRLAVHT
jgi:hypothetical protein